MEEADVFFDVKGILMSSDRIKGSVAMSATPFEDDKHGGI